MQVLDDMQVRDTVECLVEIDHGSKDCMGLVEVKGGVDEVQELDKIVNDGGSFHPILAWIHIREDNWEEPLAYKCLIDLAEEKCLGYGTEIVFTAWGMNFCNWKLGFLDPWSWIFGCFGDFVVNN